MRRTHASLCRQAGIDPKLVADQLGHGLGANLDVYTVVGLDQRQQAVQTLEATIVRPSTVDSLSTQRKDLLQSADFFTFSTSGGQVILGTAAYMSCRSQK
jgi:hypothetical protein